jgi:hypothetical protein
VKDAISYARIQTNNAYYKEVLGLKMNNKVGSSRIYLTDEQYTQVKISKFFNIHSLILAIKWRAASIFVQVVIPLERFTYNSVSIGLHLNSRQNPRRRE